MQTTRLTHIVRASLFALSTLNALTACSNDTRTVSAPTVPAVAKLVAKTDPSLLAAPVGTTIAGTQVQVQDANGNPIGGVTVSFTVYDGGSVSLVNTVSDANGLATVDWTLGTTAGADSLEASVGANVQTYLVATAQPGAVAQLVAVDGNQEQLAEGASAQLVVKALDQYGNVVPNANITWVDQSGGSLSATSSVTDASGLAQVTLTTDLAPEQYTVLAEAATVSVTFVDTSN